MMRGKRVLDVLAAMGLIALVALPFAAVASERSARQPDLPDVVLPRLRAGPAGPDLRSLPAFTGGSAVERDVKGGGLVRSRAAMERAVERQAHRLLGAASAAALLDRARDPIGARSTSDLERVLGPATGPASWSSDAAAAANDLAGLLVLAGAAFPQSGASSSLYPNAGPIAYLLYDRARGGGTCDPQLNLGFLASTASGGGDEAERELTTAVRRCPDDPTPNWLLGQLHSFRGGDAEPFRELQRRTPRSPLGWAGHADWLIRRGLLRNASQRFSARNDFRQARALYRRAEALDRGRHPELAAGLARAEVELGLSDDAVRNQERALAAFPHDEDLQAAKVEYLERGRRFVEAASFNESSLHDVGHDPPTGTLVPSPELTIVTQSLLRNVLGPVSIGAHDARLLALPFDLGSLPLTDGVTDLSFIPEFRSVPGVTDLPSWCRLDAHRRDRILAGHPDAVTAPGPPAFASHPPAGTVRAYGSPRSRASLCSDGSLIGAIALLESGSPNAAVAASSEHALPPGDDPLGYLFEADQNVFRQAGDLPHAASIVRAWVARRPNDPRALDRAGEIAFLRHHYRRAADWFARAAEAADPTGRVGEQVKQGAALQALGDLPAARRILGEANRVADRLLAGPRAESGEKSPPRDPQLLLDAYNARVQAGNTELRAHRFRPAEEQFGLARQRQADLQKDLERFAFADMQLVARSRGEALFHPEALENNQAIAREKLGMRRGAVAAAEAAVRADPANPIFLANLAAIHRHFGDTTSAADSYRSALRADPSHFVAANNLGVLLGQGGEPTEAVTLFRRALATNPNYTVARFNLGIALSRLGAGHLLESEGQLARAAREDTALRTQSPDFVTDDDTFFSDLDLSKPLPPTWQYATSTRTAPTTVAGVVVAGLILRMLWSYARGWFLDSEIESALEGTARRGARLQSIGSRTPTAVAVALLAGVLVLPIVRSGDTAGTEVTLTVLAVLVLSLAFIRTRSILAGRGDVSIRHVAFVPGVMVGALGAFVGIGFAPMPVTASEDPLPERARWGSVGLLGGVSLVLVALGRVTFVPHATTFGLIGLAMTASCLVPVDPYDGPHLNGRAALALGIAIACVGIAAGEGLL